MKTLAATFLSLVFLMAPLAVVHADVWVNGYYRSNGTYVNGHYRSSPDSNPYNNWSYPGNTNPYTGVKATGNPSTYLNNYSSGSTYSAPTYTSSSVYSSSCPANSYSSGSSCKCNYGYVVKNGACVSGSSVCMSELGLMSTYDSLSNSCKCMSGYEIGSTGSCVYKSTYSNAYTGSLGGYARTSPYSSSCPANSSTSITDSSKCSCNDGYKLNSKKTACTKVTTKDKDKICKESFGSKSVWSKDSGEVTCLCKKGYSWNEGRSKCVK
jgi:hypothetical protein